MRRPTGSFVGLHRLAIVFHGGACILVEENAWQRKAGPIMHGVADDIEIGRAAL